jgi:hypothetical protein
MDQHTVHTEMLARQVAAHERRFHRLVEQSHDDVMLDSRSRFLLEDRVLPHRVIHRQTNKPAKQYVAGDLLHQHAFASNTAPATATHESASLGDAQAPAPRVTLIHTGEHWVHALERIVQPDPNEAQRVVSWYEVIERRHCEHCLGIAIRSGASPSCVIALAAMA